MDKDVAISVKNVTMSFNLNKEKVDNLKEYFIKAVTHKLDYKKFDALKNISFDVKKGERLAIMGFNGAGKSTLLKAIVGVYKPTSGTVERSGVIAPLLELGAGFDPNYSGKENIFLYGSILGYSREYIQSKYDEIVDFSELGNFINVPLKNYSSGMKARLGFSIATAVEPDVLILDEVLSVGDAKFREKSMNKVKSMFDKGVTVLFVSHNAQQIKELCDKAILINHGEVIAGGGVDEVTELYQRISKGEKDDKALIEREVALFNEKKQEAEKKLREEREAAKKEASSEAISAVDGEQRQSAGEAEISQPVTAVASVAVDEASERTDRFNRSVGEIRAEKPKSSNVTEFVDIYSSSHFQQ